MARKMTATKRAPKKKAAAKASAATPPAGGKAKDAKADGPQKPAPAPAAAKAPMTLDEIKVTFAKLNESIDRSEAKKREADELTGKARKANSSYRAELKSGKQLGASLGLEVEDITWVIAWKDRDPQDIAREIRRKNILAQLRGLPLFGLGTLDNGNSVADALEKAGTASAQAKPIAANGKEENFDKPEVVEAAGYKSHEMMMEEIDCPYPAGNPQREHWLTGFRRRKGETTAKVADGLGKPANGAGAAAPL